MTHDTHARTGSRALFPELEAPVYLNHAAISPPSTVVRKAMERCLRDYATHGVGAAMPWFEARDRLRQELGRLIGARDAADTIALLPNTTSGVIACARSISWRAGDRIVLVEGDFPANVGPWQQIAREHDLEIVWADLETLSDRERGPAWLAERILDDHGGLRLVALSAVAFQTGWRMPLDRLGELCATHDVELFVDAIQACGVVPIDVERDHVSYLASGGHKWLMGVEGAGFLYVSKRAMERSMTTRMAGWLSYEEPFDFLSQGAGHLRYDKPVRDQASFLEVGAMNAIGYAGLAASVEILLQLGIDHIFEHVNAYLDELEEALTSRFALESLRKATRLEQSGALCLRPEAGQIKDLAKFQELVASRGVALSIPDGLVRMSPHWPNSRSEIPTIVEAFEHALSH